MKIEIPQDKYYIASVRKAMKEIGFSYSKKSAFVDTVIEQI